MTTALMYNPGIGAPMPNELLSVPQAAEIASCAQTLIRRAIQQGKLSAVRVGNVWAITRPDLEAWMKNPDTHRMGRPPKK